MLRAALVVALAACAAHPGGSTVPTAGLSPDDAVFAAVFAYELDRAGLAAGEKACLTTRGATTDGRALLAAVQARYPAAVDERECRGGGPAGPVTHASGALGVRIDIGPIAWDGDDAARVISGGPHRQGGVREVELRLERRAGTWQVVGEKLMIQT